MNSIVNNDANKIATFSHYQEIYHQITKKSEATYKSFQNNLKITYESIEDLHHKIMQIQQTYRVTGNNLSITVFLKNKQKEQFTSLERFSLYNKGQPNHTIRVVLKYDMLIIPHDSDKPCPYSIGVDLTSRVGISEEMRAEEDLIIFRPGFISFMSREVVNIKIEYVDYVISRTFLQAIDEWVNSTDQNPSHTSLCWLKKHISSITVIAGLFAFYPFYYFIKKYLHIHNLLNLNELAYFIFTSSISFIFYIIVMFLLLKFIDTTIEDYNEISYIHLNEGDKKLIRRFEKQQKMKLLKFVLSSIFTIALSIASSMLEKLLF